MSRERSVGTAPSDTQGGGGHHTSEPPIEWDLPGGKHVSQFVLVGCSALFGQICDPVIECVYVNSFPEHIV
jgi:hypothetical protein